MKWLVKNIITFWCNSETLAPDLLRGNVQRGNVEIILWLNSETLNWNWLKECERLRQKIIFDEILKASDYNWLERKRAKNSENSYNENSETIGCNYLISIQNVLYIYNYFRILLVSNRIFQISIFN